MTEPPLDLAAPVPSEEQSTLRRRAEIGPGGLRGHVARGSIVNTFYFASVNALLIVQGVLVARLLGAKQYGLWGLLTISFGTLFTLAAVGVDDKYIQQDHPDQQAAFEIAFTLQAMLCGLFMVIALVAIPLFALLYGQPRILAPGLLLAVAFPLAALQTPMWVFYRRMNFVKARFLQSVTPLVTFAVTVPLALAGVGFWSLVIGTLSGSVAATIAALVVSPYELRFRYERDSMREYANFSWPLLLNSAGTVATFQVPITLASRVLGIASVGAITLSSQITQYAYRVDDVVTHALYPAICAVKDKRELLFESFSKSNRLALLWGFPAGAAAALFARQAVHFLLGDRWKLAIPLIAVLGASAAVDQIGFNWTAFARARAETQFLAIQSAMLLAAVLGIGVPLLLIDGLPGLAIGFAAGTVASLGIRLVYLLRLFPALAIVSHTIGAIVPTLVGVSAILTERAVVKASGDSPARTIIEVLGYVVIVGGLSWMTERALLRETIRYLRQAMAPRPGIAA